MISPSFFQKNFKSRVDFIDKINDVEIYIKREDLIHPIVSGNKFRKLKYNLLEAQNLGKTMVLSFGGAYSNHIAAMAEACYSLGLSSIGIIRGEELGFDLKTTLTNNPTLKFAHQKGMQLHFVTRTDYRLKENMPLLKSQGLNLEHTFIVPEGGTNKLAVKGCEEILNQDDDLDFICSSVGTGGTFAGLIQSSKSQQHCLGFSALKGDFLKKEISKWTSKTNWTLQTDYHFGGYAKVNSDLVEFINQFKDTYAIQLDPIYTGKMFYGIFEMVKSGYFPKNTRILAIHTGGLQGIEGMNQYLKQKGLKTLN
jgi:1-aminocyclopropane-1-carboxylate deaminase